MGWTYIGGAEGGATANDTSIATGSTLNVAAGDLLVAIVRFDGATTTVSIQTGASENEFDVQTVTQNSVEAFCVAGAYVLDADANSTATVTATFGAARGYREILVLQFRPDSGETTSLVAGPGYNERADDFAESDDISTTGTDVVCVGMHGLWDNTSIYNSNVTFDGNADTGTYSEASDLKHGAYYIGTMSAGSYLAELNANRNTVAFVLCFKSEEDGGASATFVPAWASRSTLTPQYTGLN